MFEKRRKVDEGIVFPIFLFSTLTSWEFLTLVIYRRHVVLLVRVNQNVPMPFMFRLAPTEKGDFSMFEKRRKVDEGIVFLHF